MNNHQAAGSVAESAANVESKQAVIDAFKGAADEAASIAVIDAFQNAVDKAASTGKWPSYWLLTLGTVVLLLALCWKLFPCGVLALVHDTADLVHPVDLQPPEFITVALIAMILLLAGALLSMHRSNVAREIGREVRLADVRLKEARFQKKVEACPGLLEKLVSMRRRK